MFNPFLQSTGLDEFLNFLVGSITQQLEGQIQRTLLYLPSGYVKIAIENGHRNSEFSHEQWWFSIVFCMFTRGYFIYFGVNVRVCCFPEAEEIPLRRNSGDPSVTSSHGKIKYPQLAFFQIFRWVNYCNSWSSLINVCQSLCWSSILYADHQHLWRKVPIKFYSDHLCWSRWSSTFTLWWTNIAMENHYFLWENPL